MALFSSCTRSSLPAQRPADFAIAYHRSSMVAPTLGDAWRLDATGWTFEGASDKVIAGPAEPKELDSAYALVRDAKLDVMKWAKRDVQISDGHSKTIALTASGKKTELRSGTQYELVRGDIDSYRHAVDGLESLAGGALRRLNAGGPAPR